VFAADSRRVAFFLEWDRGGEQRRVLAAKLAGYARHVALGGQAWPVLFSLSTSGREDSLHRLLATTGAAVPVATLARDSIDAGCGPADAVWLVHGDTDAPRRLIDLADLADPAPEVDNALEAA
jgi:hypothetical protein